MKHVILSVRDAKSEVFGRPFFTNTIGTAIRSFADEVNRKHEENLMHTHSADFSLWQLGHYEDGTGTFETMTPKLLVQALEVKDIQSLGTADNVRKISKV